MPRCGYFYHLVTPSIQKYLNQLIQQVFGSPIQSLQIQSIGGGCINETYRVKLNGSTQFFVKLNSVTKYPGLFEKERNGLQFIAEQGLIHVPSVIAFQEVDNYQILFLEWIEGGTRNEQFWKQFGERLAGLHRQPWTNKDGRALFGFKEDNYIGSLPQHNTPTENWIDFFIQYRLEPQINLSRQNCLLQPKHLDAFNNLFARLREIFSTERSALLHGDLWSGNFMCDQDSEPVLIDPAVYFGHRSMDLAMSTLFGGFDQAFYDAYNHHFPFPKNYREQWEICNLYPLLIHLNLFGAGYLGQIESTLRRFT